MAMTKQEKRMYCSVGGDHVRNGRLALGDRLKQILLVKQMYSGSERANEL